MQIFYTPTIAPHHDSFLLNEEESKHAVRVLRLQSGSVIHLVDGRGGMYKTEIIDPHPKRTSLRALEVRMDVNRPKYHLHIAIAPTNNIDRIEWCLEKATEIGNAEFTPIICSRSERKDVKGDRLAKLAVADMQQSLKTYLPTVNPAVDFVRFFYPIQDTSCIK